VRGGRSSWSESMPRPDPAFRIPIQLSRSEMLGRGSYLWSGRFAPFFCQRQPVFPRRNNRRPEFRPNQGKPTSNIFPAMALALLCPTEGRTRPHRRNVFLTARKPIAERSARKTRRGAYLTRRAKRILFALFFPLHVAERGFRCFHLDRALARVLGQPNVRRILIRSPGLINPTSPGLT